MEIPPAFRHESVAVFLSTGIDYFPHALATIASVMENSSAGERYDIVVLTLGAIPREKLDAALDWFGRYPGNSLRFFNVDHNVEAIGKREFHLSGAFTIATYLRLFAPSIFARYPRIVNLDCDVIVLADIAELYREDLGNNLIAASYDSREEDHVRRPDSPFSRYREDTLGIKPGDGYANAGVAVYNLELMRRENIESRFFEELRRIAKPIFFDQCILNTVCKRRVRFISPAWNVRNWMLEPHHLDVFRRERANEKEENEPSSGTPSPPTAKAVHYAGPSKPWRADYKDRGQGPSYAYYWRYASLTPFGAEVWARWRKDNRLYKRLPALMAYGLQITRCQALRLVGARRKREKNARRLARYRNYFKDQWQRLFVKTPPADAPPLYLDPR